MDRSDAYELLANRLEQYRSRGYAALLALIGKPATSETVRIKGENVEVEIKVEWSDPQLRTLCVRAAALGPSTWKMERVDERIVVCPPVGPTAQV